MTKAELAGIIAKKTGVKRYVALNIIESFMDVVKEDLKRGNRVSLRGFGSFYLKKRADKMGRIISQNTTIFIPEHNIPAFKPSDEFVDKVK